MSASARQDDLALAAYWWNGPNNRWQPIRAGDWKAAMLHGEPLPNVPTGDQYFVVCVIDDDGSIANVIPHRYTIHPDGTREQGGKHLLTEEEWNFWDMMYSKVEATTEELERLHELQNKYSPWFRLPREAARALISTLPGPPNTEPGLGIHRFLAEYGMAGSPPSGRLQ